MTEMNAKRYSLASCIGVGMSIAAVVLFLFFSQTGRMNDDVEGWMMGLLFGTVLLGFLLGIFIKIGIDFFARKNQGGTMQLGVTQKPADFQGVAPEDYIPGWLKGLCGALCFLWFGLLLFFYDEWAAQGKVPTTLVRYVQLFGGKWVVAGLCAFSSVLLTVSMLFTEKPRQSPKSEIPWRQK